ncbi:bromodomain-containing protein 4 isoform X1 [Homalodisca vitripennis]|nr:bromodomain-containing protein 4 isoform X1 [Homalodisca vitripennis]
MSHRQWQDGNSLINKRNEAYLNYQKKAEQMTKQQQLIEQKKLEIQKRMEEKKKKETEEALKKLNDDKLKSEEASKSKRSSYYSYSKNKQWPTRERPEENPPSATGPTNIFNNDGSFFEQFQKISGIKVEARKRSKEIPKGLGDIENGAVKNNEEKQNNDVPKPEKSEETPEDRQTKPILPSPDKVVAPVKIDQPSQVIQQNQNIQHHMIQHQHMVQHHPMQQHQNVHQQPPMRHPMFPPQPMPPPMPMPFPPQFNPMHCGMMLPPPMAPSSIPPPAPLNPGSIPSPSPLQTCSIPSPSPLQPYAIPPPSPLIPHSIPPPSPMVPHSIPPPSPLTPHSIPPPLPLRPQSIPPPLQRPPMFLSMVPPPPPPPPEEEKTKVLSTEKNCVTPKTDIKPKMNIKDNVKDLFKNDDYSSSEDEEDRRENMYGPNLKRSHSDSDSERERKSPYSYSDKDSDVESDPKMDSVSELESDLGQESEPVSTAETETSSRFQPYTSVVIEDTQTQFPSDTKDSSNTGETAPPDLSSESDSIPGLQKGTGLTPAIGDLDHCCFRQGEVKKEIEDSFYERFEMKNGSHIKEEETDDKSADIVLKDEAKPLLEEEIKKEFIVKQDIFAETPETGFKTDEPVPKKKRRSRWAANDEKVDMPPTMPLVPPPPPPGLPPGIRPPGVGPVGMVVPSALGVVNTIVPPMNPTVPSVNVPGMSGSMISKVTRTDPAFVSYAMKSFGRANLTEAEWKKAEDHYKINLLYQDMMRKKEELQRLQAAGRNKYEYDSDEETEGGTWEHKLRSAEMEATQLWADELTEQAKGKHHIGDFLPPDELARFMEKYEALKEGREPDLSDYKEFKLKEDNIGFQMLQKLGWTEGQGLGPDGSGIMDPVNKATMRPENQGLGIERPEDVEADDDEYDAYRKRMMLAYRFRPNPMNNPRRPYY